MRQIVITGATSMIGIALIEECIKNNIEVYAIVRPQSPNLCRIPKHSSVHILECQLEELENIQRLRIHADVFYHFAWITGKKARNDSFLQSKNIHYTLNAVELAKNIGCTKFIGAGSQAEYGWKTEKIYPDTPTFPDTAYGICKLAAGSLAMLLCQQYNIIPIWGRIFSVYGSLDKKETMIKYAIKQFQKGERAEFSAATQQWDYLFSEDAGRAFYLLGMAEDVKGIYNIASGKSAPLKEYIYEIKDILHSDSEAIFAQTTKEIPKGICCDIGKLSKDSGFKPEISFRNGILKMLREEGDIYEEN